MSLSVRDVSLGERLSGVTFALEPGTVTAICGPNGAGKSSLLEVLAGLRQPEQTQRELDLVLTAALDQPDADPELRARAFALDTHLRGGFGIQRRLARLGTSARSVDFLIQAIHASLSLDHTR